MTIKRQSLEETIDAKFNALLNRLDEADVNGVKPPLNHVSGALTAAVAWIKIKRRLDEDGEWGAELVEDRLGAARSGGASQGMEGQGDDA